MVFLPSAVLVGGALLLWLARRSRELVVWAIATGSILSSWLALLALRNQAMPLAMPIWQPEALFAAQFELSLPGDQWEVAYMGITIALVVALTSLARSGMVPIAVRAASLLYTALAVVAISAGNVLTLVALLLLMDVAAFAITLRAGRDWASRQGAVLRLSMDAIGLLLILASGLLAQSMASVAGVRATPVWLVQALLLSGSAMRLGLVPLHLSFPVQEEVRRGLGTILRLFPPAVILAQLGRSLPHGVSESLRPWMAVAGGITLLVAGIQWAYHERALDSRGYIVALVSGIAFFLTAAVGGPAERVFIACALLVLLAGVEASIAEIHSPFHRLWPGALALGLVGIPWTAGGVLLAVTGEASPGWGWLPVLGAGVGAGLLSMGVARLSWVEAMPWRRDEGFVRVFFGVGLSLPALAALGVGVRMFGPVTFQALIALAIGVALAGTGLWAIRRGSVEAYSRFRRALTWLDPGPVYGALWSMYQALLVWARNIGAALEGEGALLWAMAAVLFVAAIVVMIQG
jgi:hypothetical protein